MFAGNFGLQASGSRIPDVNSNLDDHDYIKQGARSLFEGNLSLLTVYYWPSTHPLLLTLYCHSADAIDLTAERRFSTGIRTSCGCND